MMSAQRKAQAKGVETAAANTAAVSPDDSVPVRENETWTHAPVRVPPAGVYD